MAVVNIVEVSSRDLSEERLWRCNIDLPVPESQTVGYAIDIQGWVLGRRLPAIAVEIVNDYDLYLRIARDFPIGCHSEVAQSTVSTVRI